jgi:hypothetical protein
VTFQLGAINAAIGKLRKKRAKILADAHRCASCTWMKRAEGLALCSDCASTLARGRRERAAGEDWVIT